MNTDTATARVETIEEMIAGFGQHNLMAGWNVLAEEVPLEPASPALPCHWPYREVREQLFLAGRLVPPEDAERRILVMANPGWTAVRQRRRLYLPTCNSFCPEKKPTFTGTPLRPCVS